MILNTGWYNPTTDIFTLFFIILLTIAIEVICLEGYARWKKISVSDNIALVLVVLIGNLVSGTVGFLIHWII